MANKSEIKPHKVTKDYLSQNIDNGIDTTTVSHNIKLEENKKKFAQKYENKREGKIYETQCNNSFHFNCLLSFFIVIFLFYNISTELIRIINNSLVENITNDDLKFPFQNRKQNTDHSIEEHIEDQHSYYEYANSLYQYYG
ncbi:conserved Plasmodium protein, unknown function [Plasmodium chabaudi chabaudi]|uniref:Uncharacterized protein n=1 Tax=Plasmodium chabaudi chabaudi TaxID=31271 RepID=A0A4V0K2E5_PLACU|nr:conserved Plasmodium protein, unknown function [Plasmodium chabaudi chabaudi]VTZ66686.1 conserved Plasmodium protein, unknown function [Plasmodium chabaudi chabaudi]|eukprot:XP_738191.1 conserved Plasmodium protein, unknown function [Plasmodium chabaudi chabaudi]